MRSHAKRHACMHAAKTHPLCACVNRIPHVQHAFVQNTSISCLYIHPRPCMFTHQQRSHISCNITVQSSVQASHIKSPQRLMQYACTVACTQPSGACEGVGCHVRALMVLQPLGSGMPSGMWSVQGALPSHCTLRLASPSWHIFVMPCALVHGRVCVPSGAQSTDRLHPRGAYWCGMRLHRGTYFIFVMRALPSMHGRPCVCPQAHNIRLQAG